MRFKISLKIKIDPANNFEPVTIPIRYHAAFLSLLKKGLEKASPEEFDSLFNEKNKQKNYSQALTFHGSKFDKESIVLKTPNISWFFATPDARVAFNVYNAFQALKQEETLEVFPGVQIEIDRIINIHQNDITSNSQLFKTLSPIIIRQHDPIKHKDWFLSFNDDGFESVCKENLKRKLVSYLGKRVVYDIDELKIEIIKAKKTVTKVYEKSIEGALCELRLSGEPYLLNYLRDTSISSKSGLFFGYMDEI